MKLFTGRPLGAIMDTVLKLFPSAHFNWPKSTCTNRFNEQYSPLGDWTLFDSVWSISAEFPLKSIAPIPINFEINQCSTSKLLIRIQRILLSRFSCYFSLFAQLFTNGFVDIVLFFVLLFFHSTFFFLVWLARTHSSTLVLHRMHER